MSPQSQISSIHHFLTNKKAWETSSQTTKLTSQSPVSLLLLLPQAWICTAPQLLFPRAYIESCTTLWPLYDTATLCSVGPGYVCCSRVKDRPTDRVSSRRGHRELYHTQYVSVCVCVCVCVMCGGKEGGR